MAAVTRSIGAGSATAAINCAYCNKQRNCGEAAALRRRADDEDRVLQCQRYYPKALQAAGLGEGTDEGEERRAWIRRAVRR